MQLNLILAYKNLKDYIARGGGETQWQETMVAPFWQVLTDGAPFPMDHLKPACALSIEEAEKQLAILEKIDWMQALKHFEKICDQLPKAEEEIVHIAIYPSTTDIPEGLYGTGVWGNIILNINPLNEQFKKWLPFVFAHEYHHSVWGDHWYCQKGGEGLDDSFLQMMLIEGEADAFAMSLFEGFVPSWHEGVKSEEEKKIWQKLEEILDKKLSPDVYASYMFGSEALGIPRNAGYYFGIKLINSYLQKNIDVSMTQLMETAPRDIYKQISKS